MDTWTTNVKAQAKDAFKLKQVLETLGIKVEVTTARGRTTADLRLTLPEQWKAEEIRTRRAGRNRKSISPPYNSPLNSDSTVTEALAYIAAHSPEESMAALGIKSSSTYYRVVKRMKAAKNPDTAHISYI